MKIKNILFLSLVFILATIPASQAKDTQLIPNPPNGSTFGMTLSDYNFYGGISGSLLQVVKIQNPNSTENLNQFSRICSSINDPICDASKETLQATVILGPCEGKYFDPCIESLEVFDTKGARYALDFQRFVSGPTFQGDQATELPAGKTVSLWGSKDLPNVQNFSVHYIIDYLGKSPNVAKFIPRTLSVGISPYVVRAQSLAKNNRFLEVPPTDPLYKFTLGAIRSEGGSSYDANCAWQENGVCGVEQEFEEGYTYQLSIAIPKSFSGWLQGRLVDPEINVRPISENLNILTVRAGAADVPRIAVHEDYSMKNERYDELFMNSRAYALNSGISIGFFSDQLNSIDAINAFASKIQDRATLKSTKWSFKNNSYGPTGNSSNCLSSDSKLMGIVTTNSMIYESGVPSFNGQALEYKVAGVHYNPDGTVFNGKYDLILRSDAARCLYKFSAAPLSAEISVTGSDGDKKVATTSLTEKDGWLHLAAYNFTFSQPTIKMILKQEAVAPTPSPTSEVVVAPNKAITPQAAAPTKKISITCIKGKMIKKVTAVSPKCPKGYKKK